MNLTLRNNPVDLGVRVEVPRAAMDPMTDDLYEAKLLRFIICLGWVTERASAVV